MKNIQIMEHFKKRNWKKIDVSKGTLFYKENDYTQTDYIDTKRVRSRSEDFKDLYGMFMNITYKYFNERLNEIKQLYPISIYNAYKNNSFVSTGLEHYYNYLYKDSELPSNKSTITIQPSVRFKMNFFDMDKYNKNDKYDYSSIAFNNISIVDIYNKLDLIQRIELIIDYFSALKIHASRVTFIVEDTPRFKDNDVSYAVVKFFVDNLEVGDILSFNTKNGMLIEYGFGFERLFSRVVNKKYNELFLNNCNYSQDIVLGVNFLTLTCMFDEEDKTHGANSKINKVINSIMYSKDSYDINLIYDNYIYWKQNLKNSRYEKNFEEVTKEYLKLLKRK